MGHAKTLKISQVTTRSELSSTRQDGIALLEISVAVVVFALILLSSLLTLTKGVDQRRQSFQNYRAIHAIRDLVADMQETANRPLDLSEKEGIGAVYNKYHSQSFAITNLPSGQLTVTCHPNEVSVPGLLGGPQDLNFDGDALDDLGNASAGTDLKLVPMTIVATYVDGSETFSLTAHRLVSQTTQ